MPRKKKTEEVDESIGSIGEFVEPKPEDEIPEEDISSAGEEETVPEGGEQPSSPDSKVGLGDIPPDQIKEKLQHVIVEVATRGLDDDAKAKVSDEFMFWNGIAWELLDMGDNLKSVLNNVHVKMSPTKAMLLYLGGTAAMVFALRPDLLKKVMPRKKGQIIRQETFPPTPEKKEPQAETTKTEEQVNG